MPHSKLKNELYVPDFRFKKSLNSQITCAILVNYIFLWQNEISEPYCYCFFCGMFEWRVHSHSAPCWNSNKVRKLPIGTLANSKLSNSFQAQNVFFSNFYVNVAKNFFFEKTHAVISASIDPVILHSLHRDRLYYEINK